ncbi:MAG: AMP-binding enzyme [Actinomycetota bacterium]
MANRLVVLDADRADFVSALERAWEAGDAVLPVDPRLPRAARQEVLAAARPDAPVEPGDALVVATSGTSGAAKAAVLTHAAVQASAEATSRRLQVDPRSDHWLACLPLAHVGGLSVVTRALRTATPLTVQTGFDSAAVEGAARRGCTLTSLVPTALARVDASLFRTVLLGGQAPPDDRPPNVIATYGMTETGSGVVYDGLPLDGVEVRISAEGEVQLRAPMLMRAYRDGSDPRLPGGWFPTGDAGELRDGVLHVHGRRGDVIVTGGEKVWPTVVERALSTHPAVAEVVVLGMPDEEWGQRVTAVVVPLMPSAPPSLSELRDWAKRTLPAYAAPSALKVVASLPRTTSGKVRRGAVEA